MARTFFFPFFSFFLSFFHSFFLSSSFFFLSFFFLFFSFFPPPREGGREDVHYTLSVSYCVVFSMCDILVLPVLLLLQSGKLGNMGHVNICLLS